MDALQRGCALATPGIPPDIAESIQDLVREMRRRGYDRIFRAGTAVYDIILSRSAEHGLRSDQPSVSVHVNRVFATGGHDRRMWASGLGDVRFVEEGFRLTPRLEAALAELARAPID